MTSLSVLTKAIGLSAAVLLGAACATPDAAATPKAYGPPVQPAACAQALKDAEHLLDLHDQFMDNAAAWPQITLDTATAWRDQDAKAGPAIQARMDANFAQDERLNAAWDQGLTAYNYHRTECQKEQGR